MPSLYHCINKFLANRRGRHGWLAQTITWSLLIGFRSTKRFSKYNEKSTPRRGQRLPRTPIGKPNSGTTLRATARSTVPAAVRRLRRRAMRRSRGTFRHSSRPGRIVWCISATRAPTQPKLCHTQAFRVSFPSYRPRRRLTLIFTANNSSSTRYTYSQTCRQTDRRSLFNATGRFYVSVNLSHSNKK